MSMSTSYRYEILTGKTEHQSALHKQQADRIREDEMMADRERQARLDEKIKLKSEWNESLEEDAAAQKLKIQMKTMKDELVLARRASVMVRQAALKKLLQEEYKLYETELHGLGKAFYIQRT